MTGFISVRTVLSLAMLSSAAAIAEDCSAAEWITSPKLVFDEITIPDIHIRNMTGMLQTYELKVRNIGDTSLEDIRVYDMHFWRSWFGIVGYNYSWWRLPTWQLWGGPIQSHDACERYSGLCPLGAGQGVDVSARHPGWIQSEYGFGVWGRYRTKLIFYDHFDKRKPERDKIGCVELQYEFCISGDRPACKYEDDGMLSDATHLAPAAVALGGALLGTVVACVLARQRRRRRRRMAAISSRLGSRLGLRGPMPAAADGAAVTQLAQLSHTGGAMSA